jgi:hypothetical protein
LHFKRAIARIFPAHIPIPEALMTRLAPALLILLFPVALIAEDKKPEPFKSKEGKFSVTMPEKPVSKTNKVKTDIGEVELHAFLVDQKDRAIVVMYSDYPAGSVAEGTVEKVLDGCVSGNVKALKAKLLSEDKISIGKAKHAGREIRVEMPNQQGIYRARVFLVGDRLYQVVAMGPDDYTKTKAVEDFMNSFAIDE